MLPPGRSVRRDAATWKSRSHEELRRRRRCRSRASGRRRDGEHRDRQIERLFALDGERLFDRFDVEPGHGAETPVGHLAGVFGAHVHRDVEVPGDGRDAAEVVEVTVRDEHGGGSEPELGEGLDDDVGLVAGVDDQTLFPLDDDEAVGLEGAQRHGEDFDGFRHSYLDGRD